MTSGPCNTTRPHASGDDEDCAGHGGKCKALRQSHAGGSRLSAANVDREWQEDRVKARYDWLFITALPASPFDPRT
jgi:hypothetical protein